MQSKKKYFFKKTFFKSIRKPLPLWSFREHPKNQSASKLLAFIGFPQQESSSFYISVGIIMSATTTIGVFPNFM
jgi:hypothetical protein